MNYRSDIDGLRTIAVFLVILNHAGFSFFSGGFVGVDVFFVISGFLITSIIYPLFQKNTFSFTWFLSRRIKRLMPVLFFVILITIIAFTLIMLPQDLMKFYRSIVWVIFYGGNFFFWREHGGYFDGGSQEAPLLHTWSLAVEEQYYIIWPIMLAVAYKWFKHKAIIYLSVILCIAATIFSQWGTDVTIGAAYYLLPTRFFELLVGSCLALSWQYLPKPKQAVSHILSLIGLTLIIASALLLTEHHSFPGYNALYPVIGTALIIYASSGFINRFLSLKPMVFTGNISYSLYLWHWPILVVARYMSVDFTLTNQIIFIVITYFLSILSWKYIEQPCRTTKISSFKNVLVKLYTIPAIILILFITIGLYFNGFENRFSQPIIAMDNAVNTFSSKSREACHSPYRRSEKLPNEQCLFGNKQNNQKANIFVFGDSHANHMIAFIEELAKDAKLTGIDYTLDRCLPIFDLKWGSNLHLANKCENRNTLAQEYIKAHSFDFVVMSASWPGIQTKRLFIEQRIEEDKIKAQLLSQQLEATISDIINTGATPVILEDIPTLGGKSPKCPIKKALFNDALNCDIFHHNNEFFHHLLINLQRKYPQIILLEPHQLMCSDKKCEMALNNIPLYRDEDHLNEVGSSVLGQKFLQKYKNPFKTNKRNQ